MLTVLGILLLLCSGTAVAFSLVSEEEKKYEYACGLLELSELTRDCVAIYSMTGAEMLSKCNCELLQKCGYFEKSPPESFKELCERSVKYDKESGELLEAFANSFGTSYREHERERCELLADALRKRTGVIKEQLPAKRKMIFGVSLCGAVVTAILLI